MLKLMRNKELKKKVIWVVAILIIISFGIFGTAYLIGGIGSDTSAGKLFGKKVSLNDFQKTYHNVRIQAVIRYGDKYKDVEPYLNLETEAWDRLILLHEANKQKIKVTNNEIIAAIERLPFFQRNKQFDSLLYNDVLRYAFRVKPRNFEEGIRDQLKFQKLFSKITKDVTVPEEEILKSFHKKNEKVQVSYILVSPDDYIDESKFNETQAKEYFETNKLDFVIPSSVNVEYIELPLTDNTDKEMSEEVLEEAKQKVREKAEEIVEQLKENPSFEEIAKENNLEAKTTGFFSLEEPKLSLGWSYEVFSQIFGLPVDTISPPFESSNAIQIVRVTERKEASIPEYDDVADKVKTTVLREAAKEVTQLKTEEYLTTIKNNLASTNLKDFSKTASAIGFEVFQTPEFNRGQYLPKIGISKNFQDTAFSLSNDNKISEVIETEKGFSILYLDNHLPAKMSDFEEQKSPIENSLLSEKRNAVFNDFVTQLRLEAKLLSNLGQLQKN